MSGAGRRPDYWANRLPMFAPDYFTERNRSHWFETWAMRVVRARPAGVKLVLCNLANHADENGRCWPSIRAIADETGLAASTVQEALRALERRGLIESTPRPKRKSTVRQLTPYREQLALGVPESGTPNQGVPESGTPTVYRRAVHGVPESGTEVHIEVPKSRKLTREPSKDLSSSRQGPEISSAAAEYAAASNGE